MSENRIIFVNGQAFDGTGAPSAPNDVVVRGDHIESVRPGGGSAIEAGDQVVDCAGATVMPGMIESHAHLTFPSAVGHIDPSFNPPLDVSFFRHMPTPEEHLAMTRRNAQILLEAGFTSAYSAGSLTPVPTEVWYRAWCTARSSATARSSSICTSPRPALAPVIVHVHGGGWRRGSRREPLPVLGAGFYDTLAAEGFAVAAIDYRLSGEALPGAAGGRPHRDQLGPGPRRLVRA